MKDELGNRMKYYEDTYRITLTPKQPLIIRIDGKAFHTFTRNVSVFDENLSWAMAYTALQLCESIQGAQIAYTQSDEISILLKDWDRPETQPWFGGNLQKIVSVSASMATGFFRVFYPTEEIAFFDSRAFTLPMDDVDNYFIWRQLDCRRNSVNAFARQFCSQKKLQGMSCVEMKNHIKTEYGEEWESLSNWKRNGVGISKDAYGRFEVLHFNTPVFTENRDWILNTLSSLSTNEGESK